MTIEELRKFRNAEPFHPFSIQLLNGRKMIVRRPENIGFSESSRRVSVFEISAGEIVDLSQIAELKALKRAAKNGNGRRDRNGRN